MGKKMTFYWASRIFIQREQRRESLMICTHVKTIAEQEDKSSHFYLYCDHSAPYRRISQESGNNNTSEVERQLFAVTAAADNSRLLKKPDYR